MNQENPDEIFKKASTTYYNATKFFTPEIAKQVTDLYVFVRVIDDFVDNIPAKEEEYYSFKKEYLSHLKNNDSNNSIIVNFVDLLKLKDFQTSWVDAFFESMEMDLNKREYTKFSQTKEYIYGSAEVIGLFMSKIMDLPQESFESAKALGCSMQYINMIRDFNEDLDLQRIYLPISKENRQNLEQYIKTKEFNEFIIEEINRYLKIQKQAEEGFKYIPKQYLIPIKTASDMYKWTAKQIYKNPQIIFKKKVKPSKIRVILMGLKNKVFL